MNLPTSVAERIKQANSLDFDHLASVREAAGDSSPQLRWESIIDRGHELALFFPLGHVTMRRIAWHEVSERHLVVIVHRCQRSQQQSA